MVTLVGVHVDCTFAGLLFIATYESTAQDVYQKCAQTYVQQSQRLFVHILRRQLVEGAMY